MNLKYKDRVKIIEGFYSGYQGVAIGKKISEFNKIYDKYLIKLDDGLTVEEEFTNLKKIDLDFN